MTVAHMRSPAGWEEPAQRAGVRRGDAGAGRRRARRARRRGARGRGRPGGADPGRGAGPLHDPRTARSTSPSACRPSRRTPSTGRTEPGRPTRSRRPRPKVLLHDHLDGGLRPATVVELAGDDGLRACRRPTSTSSAAGSATSAAPARCRATCRRSGTPSACMQTREALVRVGARVRPGPRRRRRRLRRGALRARAARRALAARGGGRGGAGGLPAGLRGPAASASARCSPRCGTRRARSRSPSSRCATATEGVVGFDIAGAEAGYPPTRAPGRLPAPCSAPNGHYTIHAGEGLRAAVDLGGAAGVPRRPARPRRADRRRHRGPARTGQPGSGRLAVVRPRQAHPAGDVPDQQRADGRRRARSPSTRSACCAGCSSGSPSTPTTG